MAQPPADDRTRAIGEKYNPEDRVFQSLGRSTGGLTQAQLQAIQAMVSGVPRWEEPSPKNGAQSNSAASPSTPNHDPAAGRLGTSADAGRVQDALNAEAVSGAGEWGEKTSPSPNDARHRQAGVKLPPGVTAEQYATMQAMVSGMSPEDVPSTPNHDPAAGRLGTSADAGRVQDALNAEAVSGTEKWTPSQKGGPSNPGASQPVNHDPAAGRLGGQATSAHVESLLAQAEQGGHSGGIGLKAAESAHHFKVGNKAGPIATAAFAVVAGVGALAAGAPPAEAAEAAVETAVPFVDAGKELASGNTDAAQKSAMFEGVGWAGSSFAAGVAGAVGAGPAAVTVAAVVGGMVACEAGKMIYETPERLQTGEKFQKEKESIVSRFEGGKDGHVAELVNAIHGEPTDTVRGLEDPETMAAVENSLKSEKRDGDLKTLDEFKDVDQQHVEAMKKFDVDISPEKRISDKNLDTMHNQLGF